MEWYYEKNGAQEGPISESELKGLLAVNQITPATLVWKEGMADWAPFSDALPDAAPALGEGLALGKQPCPTCGVEVAASELIPVGLENKVCPHCREQYAQSLKEGVNPVAGFKQKRGTGGQTPNSELRSNARSSLAGSWGSGIAVTLLNWVIVNGLAYIPFLGSLIQWIISGPITFGYHQFFLKLVRGEPAEVGDLFSGFTSFWRCFCLYFIVGLIVALAALAAALPGIILIVIAATSDSGVVMEENPFFILGIFVGVIPAVIVGIYFSLKYALVYLISIDDEDIGVMKALERSGQMMNGRKGKLLGLMLSFIGWHILGLLAFGIGLLWSYTYMMAAFAAFYDDLGDEV